MRIDITKRLGVSFEWMKCAGGKRSPFIVLWYPKAGDKLGYCYPLRDFNLTV
jgi:hypothetical protein